MWYSTFAIIVQSAADLACLQYLADDDDVHCARRAHIGAGWKTCPLKYIIICICLAKISVRETSASSVRKRTWYSFIGLLKTSLHIYVCIKTFCHEGHNYRAVCTHQLWWTPSRESSISIGFICFFANVFLLCYYYLQVGFSENNLKGYQIPLNVLIYS